MKEILDRSISDLSNIGMAYVNKRERIIDSLSLIVRYIDILTRLNLCSDDDALNIFKVCNEYIRKVDNMRMKL